MGEATKRCGRCHQWKPLDAFEKDYKHKRRGRSVSSYCRQCKSEYRKEWVARLTPDKRKRWNQQMRRHTLKKTYGLSGSDEWALRQAFDNSCAVCRSTEDLCIDHCHTTGRVRGILCARCNHALGHALDSPERLHLLAGYLENPPAYQLELTGKDQLTLEDATG